MLHPGRVALQGRWESLFPSDQFREDRPGHDRRYAINPAKIQRELGWQPKESFESGSRKTVMWYLENANWVERVTSGVYQDWVSKQYA